MGQLSKFSTENEDLFLVYISQKYDCFDWLIFTVETFFKKFLRDGQDLDHKRGKWHNMKVSLLTGKDSKLSCLTKKKGSRTYGGITLAKGQNGHSYTF
jgi:hypothetical protein